jgi:hypothetical protein
MDHTHILSHTLSHSLSHTFSHTLIHTGTQLLPSSVELTRRVGVRRLLKQALYTWRDFVPLVRAVRLALLLASWQARPKLTILMTC